MSIEYGSSPSERKAAYQYFIKKYSEKSKTLFNGKSFEEFCDTNHVYQVNNGHYYDQKYKSSGEPFVVLRSPDNKRENVFTGGHSMSFIIDNSAFCSSWGHKWFMKASRYLPMNQKFENVSISHNEKVWLDKVSILDSNGVSHEWDSIWYMYNR